MPVCLYVSVLPKGTLYILHGRVGRRGEGRTDSARPRNGDSLSTNALFTDPDSANSTYAYLPRPRRYQQPVPHAMLDVWRKGSPLGMSGEFITEDRYPINRAASLEMLL